MADSAGVTLRPPYGLGPSTALWSAAGKTRITRPVLAPNLGYHPGFLGTLLSGAKCPASEGLTWRTNALLTDFRRPTVNLEVANLETSHPWASSKKKGRVGMSPVPALAPPLPPSARRGQSLPLDAFSHPRPDLSANPWRALADASSRELNRSGSFPNTCFSTA
jgi:hypothetical protein